MWHVIVYLTYFVSIVYTPAKIKNPPETQWPLVPRFFMLWFYLEMDSKPARGAALSDFIFISLSLFGFGIIFVLGLVLPRIKIKQGNNSITQNPTCPKRVYKI